MAVDRARITQQAEKLIAQGKIDQAIGQLELLVRDNPRDMNTINKIGDLYSRIGKKREAILQFNKIGDFYAKDGFFLKAIAIYKKVMKLDPSHLDSYVRLAELYSKQGLVLEARAQYQIAAQQHLKAGAVKKAIEVYQSMVVMDPADVTLRTTLADLLAGDGRAAEAAEEYTRIGGDLERKGKSKEARAAYHKAASLHPGASGMSVRVAETHLAEGDFDGALAIAQEALKKGENADLHATIAEIHLKASRSAAAVTSFERAVTLSPTRMDLTLRLVAARLAHGDAEAAHRTLENRADALVKDGKGKDAVALAEQIAGPKPAPPGLRLLMKLCEGLNDAAGHLKWAEQLIGRMLESGDREGGARLAETLLAGGRLDGAAKDRLTKVREEARKGSRASVLPPADDDAMAESPAFGNAEIAVPSSLEPEDEDFITEHMTEADVFMKYGLGDRAIEQLQAVIEKYPAYAGAYQKMKEILLEEGNRDAARRTMAQLVKAHLASESVPAARSALEELRRFDPEYPEIPQLASAVEAGGWSGSLSAAGDRAVDAALDPVALDARTARGGSKESGASIGEEDERAPAAADLATVDSLLAAGRRDEAVAKLRDLAASCGSHPDIVGRMRQAMSLAARPATQKAAAAAGTGRPVVQAIPADEHEEEFEIHPEHEEPTPAAASPETSSDLMDLASEIDAALSATTGPGLMAGDEAEPEGNSLEEIVEAFKKGIEQQVSEDDYHTRYNLAIAYKEMGLLDEAIGEFQSASKDPELLVECCSMLGVCFREKNLGSLATRWYRRGLEACNGRDDETSLGLRYDLAMLFVEMGERQQALDLLTEVYGVNSRFRDVASKLRELQGATSA